MSHPHGKELVLNLTPSSNEYEVAKSLKETSLALELLIRKGSVPITEIADIDIYIKNLNSGNSISAKALLEIANVLKIARELKEYLYEDKSFDLSNFTLLENIFEELYSNENIEHKIFNCIIDENTIDDKASSALSSLRRNRRKLEQDIREKLSNFIHSGSYSKWC